MAQCRHCNLDGLVWYQDPESEKWMLKDDAGERHRCLSRGAAGPSGGTRINPAYRLVDAMSPKEIAAMIAYAVNVLIARQQPVPVKPKYEPASDEMRERLHKQRESMRIKLALAGKEVPPLQEFVETMSDETMARELAVAAAVGDLAVDDEHLPF